VSRSDIAPLSIEMKGGTQTVESSPFKFSELNAQNGDSGEIRLQLRGAKRVRQSYTFIIRHAYKSMPQPSNIKYYTSGPSESTVSYVPPKGKHVD